MREDDIDFVTQLIQDDELGAPEHETAVPNLVD